MEAITLGIAIAALIVGTLACVFAFIGCYKVVGIEKSTHSVQYMPVEDVVKDPFKNGFDSFMNEDLEEKLAKDHKLYKEEVEELMPQFASDDEDKKVISW